MASYMLKVEKLEDAASLVNPAISAAVDAQAEYVYFDLMQHFLIIRVRWGSRMRMLWRGPRAPEVMTHLKAVSGMDASEHRAVQNGEYPYLYQEQRLGLPAVCERDRVYEQIVLDLTGLLAQ